MKKVLITGVTGFVGQHLAEYFLSQKSFEVIGTYRSEGSLDKLKKYKDTLTLKQIDLHNADAIATLIGKVKPDYLYHLAAQASPAVSFKSPLDTLTNNITSEFAILEAVHKNDLKNTRVLTIATGEMYGLVSASDIPIDELTPLRPVSPYSVSKIAQDYMSLQYHLAYGVDSVRVRPFNHVGPGQKDGYVIADFAKQIAEIEKGKKEPVLIVGNLEAKRDFTDVRDMVRAYALVLEKGVSGEVYNLGSGKSHKISDMLKMLLQFSSAKIEVRVDPAKFRPIDVPEIVCDSGKFHKLTGWKPEIPFEKTLEEILDYWREIV